MTYCLFVSAKSHRLQEKTKGLGNHSVNNVAAGRRAEEKKPSPGTTEVKGGHATVISLS